VESGGGTSGIVISSVDIAIGVVTVDGKEHRGSDGLGSPKSLSDGEGLTNREGLRDAMNFDVDMDHGVGSGGPRALDGVSSRDGVLYCGAGKVGDIQSGIHLWVGGLGHEDGRGGVERPGSNG